MPSTLFAKPYGLFAICIFMVCLIYFYQKSININENYMNTRATFQGNEFLVDTPACQIPNLDPFDLEVRKFYEYAGILKCPKDGAFASANLTHLNIDMNLLREVFSNEVTCGYKRIWRGGNDTGEMDDSYETDPKYHKANESTPIRAEFIKVACAVNRKLVYRDFFAFVQVKPEVEEQRDLNFDRWMTETKETVEERLSVTFVGIDSVSRLNMLRQMPKTFGYLRDVMNAIDLQGYTKVADNTFVNVVPMLSGMFADECWNETIQYEYLDDLHLVWKDFAKKGFRTFFAEDYSDIAIFNYVKAGFYKQPTDYYLRPFTLAVNDKFNLSLQCYNDRPEANVVLQWLTDFLITFKNKPTFALLFNTRLTHEYLNDAGYADEPYYKFLRNYHQSNFNNNSVLIFFSDHGIRFGPIRNTYIGKIEERMPFFFLVFPPWFRSKYPKIWQNVRINQHRLTTPFDIYATLKDILDFTGNAKKATLSDRGISLFSEIPRERSCEHAAILPHWCTCEKRIKVDVKNLRVRKAAKKLVDTVNEKIAGEKGCAKLELDEIVDGYVSGLDESVLKYRESLNSVINRTVFYGYHVSTVYNYLITVKVKPSGALFEGTVQFFESRRVFVVVSEISRINAYGHQADCIQSAELKKFCYCKPKLLLLSALL